MTQTPKVCDNITAEEGEQVQWTNATQGCTIDQDGTSTFPFASDPPQSPPININPAPPTPAPKIIVDVAPSATPYTFSISCCLEGEAVRNLTVNDGLSKRKRR